ncbi:MAG: hypothetical protein ACRYG5_07050 [Janthinobacterium lividum]
MKPPRLTHVLAALLALASTPLALAQMTPGDPNGLLTRDYQWKPAPQMEFGASAPTGKYRNPDAVARRKAQGDVNACNLQCPPDE